MPLYWLQQTHANNVPGSSHCITYAQENHVRSSTELRQTFPLLRQTVILASADTC